MIDLTWLHPSLCFRAGLVAVMLGICAASALALVDPRLQPVDLFERHRVVLSLKVTAVHEEKQMVELAVQQVCKGDFAAKSVVLSAADEKVREAFQLLVEPGLNVVAYVGGAGRGQAQDLLFYAGGEGRWQSGKVQAEGSESSPAAWQWTTDLGPQTMYGTFNGHPQRLAEMMADKAQDRAYFPASVFDQFKDDLVIDRFPKPVGGVALYDINGDGRLDIYACNETGNRLYLQSAEGKFLDSTQALGLQGVTSAGCSFADVTGSGRADLLADGVIYLQQADGAYVKSTLLPPQANQQVKLAAFADIDRDGYPDVVVSKINGGLHVYLNPGAKGGTFTDATAALGLDQPECGAGQTGYFMVGDWRDDGRTALFYAVGPGLLLERGDDGRFAPAADMLRYDFTTYGEPAALTGAGCFAPTWRADRLDFIFSRDTGVNLLANVDGKPFDSGQYGNELVVATVDCQTVVAEDLNADGNVDIYAASRARYPDDDSAKLVNTYYMNRGYGSFMVSTRYKASAIPGRAHHKQGAVGVAIGDVNGDGANDLLLGGTDGVLTLIVNDVLAERKPKANPLAHEKTLSQTSLLSVQITGKIGLIGARVVLADLQGRVVGRRELGANIATGCRGPDTLNFAVREPGTHTLTVQYSDGATQTWPVDLKPAEHLRLLAPRRDAVAPPPLSPLLEHR